VRVCECCVCVGACPSFKRCASGCHATKDGPTAAAAAAAVQFIVRVEPMVTSYIPRLVPNIIRAIREMYGFVNDPCVSLKLHSFDLLWIPYSLYNLLRYTANSQQIERLQFEPCSTQMSLFFPFGVGVAAVPNVQVKIKKKT